MFKQVSTFAAAALVVAALQFSGCSTDDKSAGVESKPAPAPKKELPKSDLESIPKGATVWVNTDTLLDRYNWYKKTKEDLQAKSSKMESDLEGRMRKFETEYRAASEKAQSGALTQSQMQELQSGMMQKQRALESFKEEQGRKLMDENKRLSELLTKTLRNYLKNFAQEHGYAYVMGYSEPGQLLYADPKLDVTAAVIEGINKAEDPK